MPLAEMTNIGAWLDQEIAFAPTALDESPANGDAGPAIDLQDKAWPASGRLILTLGADSGGATSFVAFVKLQHSDQTGSGWEDYAVRGDDVQSPNLNITVADYSNDRAQTHVDVDLSGAKRYVRAVVDVDFTAGTSPTVLASAVLILGGSVDLPA